jgi:hypothetical protein
LPFRAREAHRGSTPLQEFPRNALVIAAAPARRPSGGPEATLLGELGVSSVAPSRSPKTEDRIVLLSESGDVESSPQEKTISRPVAVTHGQLRELARPMADYLHAMSPKSESESGQNRK